MNGLKRWFPIAIRVALGGIFIYAGVIKIADPIGFAGSIAAYRILPYFPSYVVAAILPWVELFAGVTVLFGFRLKAGALIIAVLNVVFIAALASAAVRGLDIDCGCFKQGGAKLSPWVALLRDLIFLAMSTLVLTAEKARPQLACDSTETPGNQI